MSKAIIENRLPAYFVSILKENEVTDKVLFKSLPKELDDWQEIYNEEYKQTLLQVL